MARTFFIISGGIEIKFLIDSNNEQGEALREYSYACLLNNNIFKAQRLKIIKVTAN